jgi:hypothetical protein
VQSGGEHSLFRFRGLEAVILNKATNLVAGVVASLLGVAGGEKPKFHSKMIKNGRWAVSIVTGYGPASYIGDFVTEADADHWISTNSKDWPQSADKPK